VRDQLDASPLSDLNQVRLDRLAEGLFQYAGSGGALARESALSWDGLCSVEGCGALKTEGA
jgi:hypothetical protein